MKPYVIAYLSAACISALYLPSSLAFERTSGGSTTVIKEGQNAFSQPAANLPMSERIDFSVGNSFFRNPWVSSPASTDARDGLGPLFNTNGCQNCHIKDGRGHPPQAGDINAVSMLVRLSVPALSDAEKQKLIQYGNIPEPNYGGQLQDFALPGAKPEGKVTLSYQPVTVTFEDGESVTLRKPNIAITDLNYGPMAENVQMSARIAPPMIGLGLLESIAAEDIYALADPSDDNGDGISGRANQVWDVEQGRTALGRFGWKAGLPTVKQQNAAAFNGDVGLTTSMFPHHNCMSSQSVCEDMPNGGTPEVSDNILSFVTFYARHLAVPARRNMEDPSVKQGQALFVEAGCHACHVPTFTTQKRPDLPALSEQTIHPYTDLLLHDMGEGLADHRGEFIANGREWRTAPLWGIGYTKEVSPEATYLHDGRARTLMEAILWHDGEAATAKQAVLGMSKTERDALVAFLRSL
ncbi:thiol oxidoreductase [Salinivibrio sp. IB574]|uniref:di-heme oxidoreductase family protein n=1 Tax=Salinivibrio sp. IB574 TaxID=1909444 RepID=UPI000988B345|nr:di-heme oxidoredictase family protein [Salinivibrio sp. IB574]OOF24644.1 thiol oxidoreductase [Salinivibrio sp. IB574]